MKYYIDWLVCYANCDNTSIFETRRNLLLHLGRYGIDERALAATNMYCITACTDRLRRHRREITLFSRIN